MGIPQGWDQGPARASEVRRRAWLAGDVSAIDRAQRSFDHEVALFEVNATRVKFATLTQLGLLRTRRQVMHFN